MTLGELTLCGCAHIDESTSQAFWRAGPPYALLVRAGPDQGLGWGYLALGMAALGGMALYWLGRRRGRPEAALVISREDLSLLRTARDALRLFVRRQRRRLGQDREV